MAVLSSQRARFDDLRSLAFGSISGTYTLVGSKINVPIRMLEISNFTGVNLLVSTDGVSDHTIIGAGTVKIYGIGSNKSDAAGNLEVPPESIYVKQESGAPTSGNVYVTVIYASSV